MFWLAYNHARKLLLYWQYLAPLILVISMFRTLINKGLGVSLCTCKFELPLRKFLFHKLLYSIACQNTVYNNFLYHSNTCTCSVFLSMWTNTSGINWRILIQPHPRDCRHLSVEDISHPRGENRPEPHWSGHTLLQAVRKALPRGQGWTLYHVTSLG